MNLGLIYLYESWPHTKPGNLQKVFGRWVVGGWWWWWVYSECVLLWSKGLVSDLRPGPS